MKPYRIYCFGGLRFESDSAIITRFRTQKTASLLAYLALHRGPQPREILADLLWPGDEPTAARHSLRMALSSLRGQLESALQTVAQTREPLFEATRFAIGLRTGALWSDVAAFEAAIRNARRAPDLATRAQFYGEATQLYAGEFLPGFYDDWCLETAGRLELASAEAKQFLRDQTSPVDAATAPTPDSVDAANHPKRGSRFLQAAPSLATLLLFDGAPLPFLLKKRWKTNGAIPLGAANISAHVWRFSSASAASQSAFEVRADETQSAAPRRRRIAICTGELSRRDHSALLQRGLGLLESAHAGQSLCCEATALFERGRDGIACRELGVFHLPHARPGAAPERIFQIARADQNATEWAPPNAQPARGAWVPRPLAPFFGRQSELESLRERTKSERLVTLSGLGGMGKTRLALQFAAQWETERGAPFGGSVFWIALADVAAASGIATAICEALRLEANAAASDMERACAALQRAGATLLVLDNFEHLIEQGALQLEYLLERAPGAHCLVTSRQLLGARGETEFVLAPLPVAGLSAPDATLESLRGEPSVALFCDRARAVRPDFALTARNAQSVAALCRQLEGLPLAIELAAARAGNWSPAQIMEHLQRHQSANGDAPDFERLDFLHNATRTAPARHRTLRATLSWSFEQLDAAHQTLLRRLCVFRGGCTVEGAQQVCQAPDAARELEELRARSLLVRATDGDGETRYSMLETVRQFAFEIASARGEIALLRRNHARYFLSWAQNEAVAGVATDAAKRLQSWAHIRSHADNLRAALRHSQQDDPATALQLMLACQCFVGSHLSRLDLDVEAALAGIEARGQIVAPDVLAEAWSLAAIQAAHRGDFGAQSEFARRRLEQVLATKNAAPDAIGWAYFHWGSALHRHNETAQARAALEQSLHFFADLPTPHCHQCRGWTGIELGNNAFDGGDLEAAARDFEACQRAFSQSGDRDGEASALAQLADVWFHANQHERAARLWEQVNAIERELADEREHEWRRHQEGKLAVARGELERGHALLLRALRSFRGDGQKLGMLRSLLALSVYWAQRGQPQRVRRLLRAEARERERLGWAPDASWEPLRQQLWERARGREVDDSEFESLELIVDEELRETL